MGRRGKVALAATMALLTVLAVNALLVDRETQKTHVTVPGGRISTSQAGNSR